MGMESVYKLSVVLNMIDQMTAPMGKAAQTTTSQLSKLQSGFGMAALAGGGMTAAGIGITTGMLKVAGSTFGTQDALAELKSLGVTDLQAMEDAAKKFSDTWAGTTKADFISAAYDIKSGISSLSDEGVAQFTELAGLTAKATKSTTGEMTSLFATGYGIYKDYYSELSDLEFGEMFAGGIATAVKDYKTSGSQMAQSISTLGGTATSANVPLEEQLSILGMLQATMSGSEAATKYKALLNTATSAGEKLGLNFLDANNQLRSLPEILGILHSKYGDTIDAMEKKSIKEAFGSDEAVAVIDLLYGKTDQLQSGILDMYGAMGGGSAAAYEMATAINSTESQQYEVLKQRLHNVTEELGTGLLPTVNSWIGSGTKAIGKVSEWIQKNQGLASGIMNAILFLGIFLTVTGSVTSVIGLLGGGITRTIGFISKLKGGFETLQIYGMYAADGIKAMGSGLINMVRQGITSALAALPGLITSVWGFTTALLANPVTWIVVGIVALVAALILLWKNWDQVSAFVQNIWNGCVEKVKAGLDMLKNVFKSVGEAVKNAFTNAMNTVKNVASEKMEAVKNVFSNITSAAVSTVKQKLDNMKRTYTENGGGIRGIAAVTMEGVKGYYTAGFNFINMITGGKLNQIKNVVSTKMEAVKTVFGNVTSAAADTVSQKLDNMKNAYIQNGGGIRGVVAASMEGIKGTYTAGFDFINTLTGGKLNGIKNLWNTGITNVKNVVNDAVNWFKQSGSRVMDTFTEGIKSAVNKPVEAVKGALAKVRQLLPFSDAKEGPLSQLTLSGKRVFETINSGMEKTAALPAKTARIAFQSVSDENGEESAAMARAMRESTTNQSPSNQGGQFFHNYFKNETRSDGGTVIQRLELHVSLEKIKELPLLIKLVEEIKEKTNGNMAVTTA